MTLRRGTYYTDHRWDRYFPHHYYSYPYYAYTRATVDVVFSPFHFYFGVFPPYITERYVRHSPPTRVFIDIPLYVDGVCRGYPDDRDDYYLDRGNANTQWKDDRELRRAVYDLEDAFRNDDITLLSPLTDTGAKIAIFARGRYQYSLDASDYLDMTRDFMRTAHTSDFDVYRVHHRAGGVYQVFAKHTYRDQEGASHSVYLCIVLERLSGRWTITQIDTAPDRLEN